MTAVAQERAVVFYREDGEPGCVWPAFPDGKPVRLSRRPYATLRALPLSEAFAVLDAAGLPRPDAKKHKPVPIPGSGLGR
ncbi:MAG: hypothetical protein M3Q74_06385 [Pseudomonadota bacterium]|nr:hypothetical protein [Pseudomonadota bacterium]